MNVVVTNESVTVAGKTVLHNEHPWRTATNRHTNANGSSWGWIDQAPGNVCWSDNEAFNSAAASAMVRAHNQWLEDQQPLSIKIIKAKREYETAKAELDSVRGKYEAASKRLSAAEELLNSLHATQEPA